jgi:hypothetical protein
LRLWQRFELLVPRWRRQCSRVLVRRSLRRIYVWLWREPVQLHRRQTVHARIDRREVECSPSVMLLRRLLGGRLLRHLRLYHLLRYLIVGTLHHPCPRECYRVAVVGSVLLRLPQLCGWVLGEGLLRLSSSPRSEAGRGMTVGSSSLDGRCTPPPVHHPSTASGRSGLLGRRTRCRLGLLPGGAWWSCSGRGLRPHLVLQRPLLPLRLATWRGRLWPGEPGGAARDVGCSFAWCCAVHSGRYG